MIDTSEVKSPRAVSTTPGPFSDSARRNWIAGICFFCSVLITIQSWSGRFAMNPDGVSYLDMADKLLHGDFSPLLHAYWSPLYPCLLAAALKLFPDPSAEFQTVHIANWLIGLAGLASFTFFLNRYLNSKPDSKGAESLAAFRCRTGFAYTIFLWGTLEATDLSGASPDACIIALVYLAAGLILQLTRQVTPGGSRLYITAGLLGVTLAVACLAKSALVPLSVFLLILLAVVPWQTIRPRGAAVTIALSTFLLFAGPYFAALSYRHHKLTIGDSGKLNYAWSVQRDIPMFAGWIGQPSESGTPVHPPRLIRKDPPVLEFRDMAPGTYPLWYDPAYFHEGLLVKFSFARQMAALIRSASAIRWAFGSALYPLLSGLIVLGFMGSWRGFLRNLSKSLLLWWSLAAFGMYSLVVFEPRYNAPFMVLFCFVCYEAFAPGHLRSAQRSVLGVVAICILFFQLHALLKKAGDKKARAESFHQLVAAEGLERLGLLPGDEIATVGGGFNAYYARLAKLRIVANIGYSGGDPAETGEPPTLTGTNFTEIAGSLRRLHVKAIVTRENPNISTGQAWRRLSDSDFWALLL